MSVRIKICGLFLPEDALYVNEAAPDYAGFVFVEKSRRFISFGTALLLREALRPGIRAVGVFADAAPGRIAELHREGVIDIVQLHGGEDDAYIKRLRELLPGAEIWKAYTVRTGRDLFAAAESGADRVLLDSGGGTGQRFDWSLLTGFPRPFILAGGLTPAYIAEAAVRLSPFAVDLSSGVETGGKKDGDKIRAAVRAAREC